MKIEKTDALLAVVNTIVNDIRSGSNFPPIEFGWETPLGNLELDSLDRVELLIDLENKTGLSIDEREASGCFTVGDLVAVHNEHA